MRQRQVIQTDHAGQVAIEASMWRVVDGELKPAPAVTPDHEFLLWIAAERVSDRPSIQAGQGVILTVEVFRGPVIRSQTNVVLNLVSPGEGQHWLAIAWNQRHDGGHRTGCRVRHGLQLVFEFEWLSQQVSSDSQGRLETIGEPVCSQATMVLFQALLNSPPQ